VITLTPSATEIVVALGAADRLVGVDRFSTPPPAKASLPRVGDFLHPDAEAIVSLHPDLVILDAVQVQPDAILHRAGLRTLPIPLASIADIRAALIAVGDALGDPAAARRVVAALDADLDAAARTARPGVTPPRVLIIVDRRPGSLAGMVGAGPTSYLGELLVRAGAQNCFADAGGAFAPISAEGVLARRPDVIIDLTHTDDAHASADWDALSEVPAVARRRVYQVTDPAFVTPGPGLGKAARELARLIW
jgi:iron complex transport system substrate-binding protein